MKFLKALLAITTVLVAIAAIFTNVDEEKKKKKELDEFFCPETDEPIVRKPKEYPYEQVEKDVLGLEKLESRYVSCYFTFKLEDEQKALNFQEQCSEFGLSTSMEENIVDVMYSGETSLDELNEFFMKLYPVLDELKPEYQGVNFD